jgi:tetratricopeptide (TPR) repeat protein
LINGIFYEHFLYLPLVFFFSFWIILFSSFWLTIFSRSHPSWLNKIASICAVLVLLAFVARNVSRQFDWNNSIRFYKQTLVRAPKSVRIINGLGMAYAEKGELDKAIKEYSRIPKINPNIPNAYHNLANAHAANGNLDGAEKNYLKALEVDPNFHFSAQSLINLYQQTGQKEKLEKLLTRYQK